MKSFIPTEEEKLQVRNQINSLTAKLRLLLGSRTKIDPVGSTVKGTFVSGSCDIDIYITTKHIDKFFKIVQSHFQPGHVKDCGTLLVWFTRVNNYDIDFVFITPESAKYDTHLHTKIFGKQLTSDQKEDVITLKAFFKTYGLYGAEMGGITGVALEALVLSKGNAKNVITYLRKFRGQKEVPHIQDPALSSPRNLLASIIPKRWKEITTITRRFRNFRYNNFTKEQFEKKYSTFHFLTFKRHNEASVDFATLLSVAKHTAHKIRNSEKDVKFQYDVFVNPHLLLLAYKVSPATLSKTKERTINAKQFPKQTAVFIKKHGNAKILGELVVVKVPRKFQNPHKTFRETVIQKMEEKEYEM